MYIIIEPEVAGGLGEGTILNIYTTIVYVFYSATVL
jgi:hypothetical protein